MGLLIGLFVGQYIQVHQWALLAAVMLVALGLYSRRVLYIPILVIAAAVIGMSRGSYHADELGMYAQLIGRDIHIQGVVSEDPTVRRGQAAFVIESVQSDRQSYTGAVYVTTSAEHRITRGDTVSISGMATAGFGSYGAAAYRAELLEKIPSTDIGIMVRNWFGEKVESVIDPPRSDLGMGFLTGQKSELPADLMDALQVAGLTHVVVASGYNLTILVRLSRRLFMKVSKFVSMFGSVALVVCFIAVAGMGPSLERAAIVTLLSLAAWYYGRRFHPLVLLSMVAAATAFIKPSFVWSDLGWALSFLAFFGVMIVAPLIQTFFFGDKKPGILRQILGETVAAHILTAPLLMATFGMFSHVAVFANLLVLPLVPVAMLLTFCSGVGAVLPFAGDVFGMITEVVLGYMIRVVYFFANMPWAVSELEIHWPFVVGIYALIGVVVAVLVLITRHDMTRANIID